MKNQCRKFFPSENIFKTRVRLNDQRNFVKSRTVPKNIRRGDQVKCEYSNISMGRRLILSKFESEDPFDIWYEIVTSTGIENPFSADFQLKIMTEGVIISFRVNNGCYLYLSLFFSTVFITIIKRGPCVLELRSYIMQQAFEPVM